MPLLYLMIIVFMGVYIQKSVIKNEIKAVIYTALCRIFIPSYNINFYR